jgi:hypothetical protein
MEIKDMKTEAQEPKRDAYRETVNRIVVYLDGLPGGARQAWQEAAYQSFLADKLEHDDRRATRFRS